MFICHEFLRSVICGCAANVARMQMKRLKGAGLLLKVVLNIKTMHTMQNYMQVDQL